MRCKAASVFRAGQQQQTMIGEKSAYIILDQCSGKNSAILENAVWQYKIKNAATPEKPDAAAFL